MGATFRGLRRGAAVGVVTVILILIPWTGHANEPWVEGRQFGLVESNAGSDTASTVGRSLVASLSPGSVLIA